MPDHLIPRDEALKDLLACSAYLAEDVESRDAHGEALRSIVPLYLIRGDVDLAAELANTVEDPFTRDKLLTAVAEKCAEIGDDEYAVQLADAIEDTGVRSQAFEKIAIQHAAKGEYDKALSVADEITHPEYVFADLALRYASASDDAGSKDMLDRIDYPAAKVSALQAIAQLEINGGQTDKAKASLEAAATEAAEIEHDEERIRSMCEIGSLFVQAGDNESAVATFRTAAEQADTLVSHRDFFLGNAALGLMQAGSEESSDEVVSMLRDKTQAASCLLAFSKEYRKRGDDEDAVGELEEAYAILRSQKDSEVRDSRSRFAVHRMIAVEFGESGMPERAMAVAQEIPDEGEKTTALSHLAQVFSMAGSDDLARQALRAIDNDPDRLYALVGMSDVKFQNDEKERAVEILDEASSLAETIPHLGQRSTALNDITTRYVQSGDKTRALSAARHNLENILAINNPARQAAALASLSHIYDTAGFETGETEAEFIRALIRKAQF